MAEFELIDAIVAALGDSAASPSVRLGPGDDAAVLTPPANTETVASIDTLVEGVHFPTGAPPVDLGYRALAVSLSDLAAMAAEPGYVLVALTLPELEKDWATALATGMAEASRAFEAPIVGGNLSRGPLTISVSVHGWAPPGCALARSGAKPGDGVFVTGPLGASAAAVEQGLESAAPELVKRYYRPPPRTAQAIALRDQVSAAIDISDGLVADAGHVASASGVRIAIERDRVPVFEGARLQHALFGSDDYELLLTSPTPLTGCFRIGEVCSGDGVTVDGELAAGGYDHFG